MTSISSVGASPSLTLSGSTAIASTLAAESDSRTNPVEASTQLTLGTTDALPMIYSKPSQQEQRFEQPRAWASPPTDAISQRMQSNVGNAGQGLAATWRGIGGDLLNRFKTTQTDYFQTLADYSPVTSTRRIDNGKVLGGEFQTSGVQALAAIEDGAYKANLQIRTRSGQTVDIKISSGSKSLGVSRGLHAEIHTTGTLTTAERNALAQLSNGLDQALEGLGTYGKVNLDMSGLLNYDKSVLSQLDLTVKGPHRDVPVASFGLHLNDNQHELTLQGQAGKLAISVDSSSPTGAVSKLQQQDSIQKYLAQVDAAGYRSHSKAELVAQFKNAFTEMHSAASGGTPAAGAAVLSNAVQAQVQPLLSGLNDFQASFGGDFDNGRFDHYATEAGHSDYKMSQKTSFQAGSAADDVSIRQTLRTQLNTKYAQSRGGAMIDTSKGYYDSYRIEDSSMAMTSIDVSKHRVSSAVKQTLLKQFLSFEKLVDHHVAKKSGTPTTLSLIENLL
jgi:hypothetical protein